MRKIALFFVLFFAVHFSYSQSSDPNLGIIPAPQSVSLKSGQFTFSGEAAIM